jgi:hypothetical protein
MLDDAPPVLDGLLVGVLAVPPLLLLLLLQAATPTAQATANAPTPNRRASLGFAIYFAVLRGCHPAYHVRSHGG